MGNGVEGKRRWGGVSEEDVGGRWVDIRFTSLFKMEVNMGREVLL